LSQVKAGFGDMGGAGGVSILQRARRCWLEAAALAGGVAAAVTVHRYVVAFSVPVAIAAATAGALTVGAWRWRRGRGSRMRWRRTRWGWSWAWDWRSGEWWIGARRNFPMDALELNFLGLTLLVGRG
jgi:hypothetical protein